MAKAPRKASKPLSTKQMKKTKGGTAKVAVGAGGVLKERDARGMARR